MPSKYENVLPKLPKLPAELRDGGRNYQAQIDVEKQRILREMEKPDPICLSREWRVLRSELSVLEEQQKAVNLKLRAYEQLMEDAYELKGVTRIDLAGMGNVTFQPEPHCVVVDQPTFDAWCVENGHGAEMHLAWSTTNSMTKERLLRGAPEPPGVAAFFKPKFVLRKP